MSSYHVDKWCAGRDPVLAMAGRTCLDMADRLADVMESIRSGEGLATVPGGVDPAAWGRLYDDPEGVFCAVHPQLGAFREAAKKVGAALNIAPMMQAHSMPEQVQVQAGEAVKEAMESRLLGLPGLSPGTEVDLPDDAADRIESQFFLRVLFPCWIEYGMNVDELLAEAQEEAARWDEINLAVSGKTAIEKLLRLDPLAINEATLARWHARISQTRHESLPTVARWLTTPPDRPLTPQNIKYYCGAFLSVSADILRNVTDMFPPAMRKAIGLGRITSPDIRRLYDAHAQDVLGARFDPDFKGQSEDTFRKGIQRYRKFLERVMVPGQ